MQEAIREAELAKSKGEVPIGAVITADEKIIARGHNQVESFNRITAHAELLTIEDASKYQNNWRLTGCTLWVTLEPCAMCLAAARFARISQIVYGAMDSRQGGIKLSGNILTDPNLGPQIEVVGGIEEEICRKMLQEFFKEQRAK